MLNCYYGRTEPVPSLLSGVGRLQGEHRLSDPNRHG